MEENEFFPHCLDSFPTRDLFHRVLKIICLLGFLSNAVFQYETGMVNNT